MYRSTTTRHAFALCLALGLAPAVAHAQTPDELQQARELFQQGYRDEQEKRFAEALEKFRRVASVKETPAVRYRIGAALEGLGRLREARDTFRALAAASDQMKADEQDIAASATERVVDLDRRVPKLLVRVEGPPPDVRLVVDGAPVAASAQGTAIELDPGDHVIAATAPGHQPFETKIVAEERAETPVAVVLEKDAPPFFLTAPRKTFAIVVIGAGAAAAVTGAALLFARESSISDLEDACPGGLCPGGRRAELEETRDRAALFGPLGGVFVAVGVVAIGAGIYLLTRPAPARAAAAVFARALREGAAFGVGGRF